MNRKTSLPFAVLLLLGPAGCGLLLGLGDYKDANSGTGGAGGMSASSSSSASSAASSSSSSTASSSSTGSSSSSGMLACAPGEMKPCYDGPKATENTGICKDGVTTCKKDGSGYGPCAGEVLPKAMEDCGTPVDDNCNGMVNEGCKCTPGTSQPCYGGPMGSENVGICKGGTQDCMPDGSGYGACNGQVLPMPEDCSTPNVDEDCDGTFVDADAGCVCSPGAMQACYTGPGGTQNVGACVGGMQTCDPSGKSWGACAGEVVPVANDNCQAGIDANCDGKTCGNALWAKEYGDAQTQVAGQVVQDSKGNIILVGAFQGSITFGAHSLISAGGYDAYVVKLDAMGNWIWGQRFGESTDDQRAYKVKVDASDNILVTGSFSTSITLGAKTWNDPDQSGGGWFAKLDPLTGNVLWSFGTSDIGSNGNAVVDAAADPNTGDVVIGGLITGVLSIPSLANQTPPSGVGQYYVAKLAGGTGNGKWVKVGGSSGYSSMSGIAIDASGNILAGGYINGSIAVQRFDPTGVVTWSHTYASTGGVEEVTTDLMGNLIAGGTFTGTLDLGSGVKASSGASFIAKLDSSGNPKWITSSAAADVYGLSTDAANNVFAVGDAAVAADWGGGAGGPGGFLVKYDVNGAFQWNRFWGAKGDACYGISSKGAQELAIGCTNGSTMNLGTGPLATMGSSDGIIGAIQPN